MDGNVNAPADLLKELKKLHSTQDALEKDMCTECLLKKGAIVAELKDMDGAYRKDMEDFFQEKARTVSKLLKIKGSISYFYSAAEEAKDPKNKKTALVIDAVKRAMEDVEMLLSAFKESQSGRFSDLSAEEKTLDQEVAAFDRKIELWMRSPTNEEENIARPSKVPILIDRDITKNLPPEIAQFQRFLDENGGQNGTWDSEDQEVFLKNWSDLKDDETLVAMFAALLPTRTETEMQDHVRWYRRYLELLSVKKEAIARWKEEKRLQQLEKLEAGKTKERETVEQIAAEKAAFEEREQNERMLRKQQLNAWRVEREITRLREEEQKTREEIEKEVKAERDRLRQQEVKEKVKQVQEERQRQQEIEKALAEEEKRLEEHARKTRLESNRPKVELRNAILMEEKLVRDRQREAEKLERQLRLKLAAEKLKPQVPSDPSRILRPTKGWEHRVRSAEPSVNRNANFAKIPHRAIPTWRQGPV